MPGDEFEPWEPLMTLLQLALDTITVDDAVRLLPTLLDSVDIVEAGTPMIKREGIGAVTRLREATPDKLIVADMKTMDAGEYEAEMAFEAGADLMTVLACASDATIAAAVDVAQRRGKHVCADLIGVADKPARARELESLGVAYLGVHAGTDESRTTGSGPAGDLAIVSAATTLPLCVAGGISPATIGDVLASRPAIVVVGSAITGAAIPAAVAAELKRAMQPSPGAAAFVPSPSVEREG
jgi:3-hexulose-6-phosphate synthase